MHSAMALHRAARQVVLLTMVHFCMLLLFGAGVLLPPEQKSLMPPSVCIPQLEFYQKIGVLNFFFAPASIGAVSLAGFVTCHHQVAAAGAGAGATSKAVMLRVLTVMAVAFSATSAGIAMAASYLILQVKAGKFSCFSTTVRVSVYASYLVIGPVLVLCYINLARMALLSDE